MYQMITWCVWCILSNWSKLFPSDIYIPRIGLATYQELVWPWRYVKWYYAVILSCFTSNVYFNSIVQDSLYPNMGIFSSDVTLILSIRRLNEFLGHFSLSWNSYNVQTDKINRMPFVIRMLKARFKKIWSINNGIHRLPGWRLKIIRFAGVLPRKPCNRKEDAFL